MKINLLAQTFNSSIIVEGAALFTRIQYQSENDKGQYVWNDTFPIKGGFGIYWSGKLRLNSLYELEFRPGLFNSSQFFSSVQVGLYLRKKYGEKYMGILGITSELHGFQQGVGNHFSPKDVTFTFNASIVRKFADKVLFHLTISKTVNSYYGYWYAFPDPGSYRNYLNWMFKLGLEYDF